MTESDDPTHSPLDDVVDRSAADESKATDAPWWRQRPSWTRILVVVTGVLVLYYLVSLVQVVEAGRDDYRDPADAIVVLGAAQYDGRPSPQLEARLDHAFTLWDEGVASTVMVTGGNQPNDRFTEAEASQRYLVDRGVPESAILMENEGSTTYNSLESASVILLAEGLDDVVLVSDPFHMKRSELISGEVGLHAWSSSTPTSVVTGWTSVRRHMTEAAGVALGRLIGFDALSDLAG